MTFFDRSIPSLEARALNEPGQQMLKAMQDLQHAYITPSPAKVARKCKWSTDRGASVSVMLENAGLVTLEYLGPHNIHAMHLTDSGRAALDHISGKVAA